MLPLERFTWSIFWIWLSQYLILLHISYLFKSSTSFGKFFTSFNDLFLIFPNFIHNLILFSLLYNFYFLDLCVYFLLLLNQSSKLTKIKKNIQNGFYKNRQLLLLIFWLRIDYNYIGILSWTLSLNDFQFIF